MRNSIKVTITVLLVCLVATACNLPGGIGGNNNASVTPNMTLTALFDTSKNIPATVTPIYVVVTNTPEAGVVVPTENVVLPTVAPPTAVPPTAVPPTAVPPTAIPVMERAGNLMVAGFITTTPVIDGSWEEWKDFTTQYPVASITYGKNKWTNADDLQASYAAVWDYDNLYISVKVHDDIYAQNATGADIYKGDSMEILLDKNLYGDFYTQALNTDDYQLGISGGNSAAGIAPSAYLWFPTGAAGVKSNITIGFLQETGLYRIEAKIPWSAFGITPTKGMHLGIAVSVSDNDDTTQNVQQTMASSAPYRSLVDPTTWREIVLTK
ncbi:MAG: sugar-binding protein [Anaerolineaceae bacterium]